MSAAFARSEQRPVDTRTYVITIHFSKAGVLSTFGHDHAITALIAHGRVDSGAPEVELFVNTAALEARDQKIFD